MNLRANFSQQKSVRLVVGNICGGIVFAFYPGTDSLSRIFKTIAAVKIETIERSKSTRCFKGFDKAVQDAAITHSIGFYSDDLQPDFIPFDFYLSQFIAAPLVISPQNQEYMIVSSRKSKEEINATFGENEVLFKKCGKYLLKRNIEGNQTE